MISYSEALRNISQLRIASHTCNTDLNHCLNQVLAEDIFAPEASPRFDNSAMDGIACHGEDVKQGAKLKLLQTKLAGDATQIDEQSLKPGTAIRIMTGAAVPGCYNSVIPIELVEIIEDDIAHLQPGVEPLRHIRKKGEDISAGDRLWRAGHRVTPETIMIAANFGMTCLPLKRFPKVLIISTGNELTEPGHALTANSIYNSSKFFLRSALRAEGLEEAEFLHIRDDLAAAQNILNPYLQDSEAPTLIISTGAVSMGVSDFIPEFVRQAGFEIRFHKVKIRPGKPVLLAQKRNLVWLGLPGNPISTAVGWHFFAKPIISTIMSTEDKKPLFTVTSAAIKKPGGLTCFYRARADGHMAELLNGQGSAQFLASTQANAYIVLPEEPNSLPAGYKVETHYL